MKPTETPDLAAIMAQYDDAKDEWDQAELWEHISGLISRIRNLESAIDSVRSITEDGAHFDRRTRAYLLIKRIRIAINLEATS